MAMPERNPTGPGTLNRRSFLHLALAVWAGMLAACTPAPRRQPESGTLPPTPACGDGVTASQTAGPYYSSGSPERTSLYESGMGGVRLTLSGQVLTRSCQPVRRAKLDFWQADETGAYDNQGYKLRGHLFTDSQGRYTLQTVVPGLYPGRTRHIHVSVQAPGQPVLTTQLYFPREPANRTDRIYRPELEMAVGEATDGQTATFDFVLDIA